jgi:Fe2+ transport system protein A
MNSRQNLLSYVGKGQSALVVGMMGGNGVRGRLESLGIVPGVEVDVLQNGGNGPLLITVGEGRLSLGRGIAEKVLVA